jgi:hypothetical protein
MTDSATQSAGPPVKVYQGSDIIPIGRRFEPKRSFFLGLHERRNFFVSRGNTFPPGRKSIPPPLSKRIPPLVQPATTRFRFVWANSLKRAKFLSLTSYYINTWKLPNFPTVTFWQKSTESRNRSYLTQCLGESPSS